MKDENTIQPNNPPSMDQSQTNQTPVPMAPALTTELKNKDGENVKFDYAPKSTDPNVKGPAITDDNLKERLANLNKVSKEDREAGDKSAPKIDQKDFSDVTKNVTEPVPIAPALTTELKNKDGNVVKDENGENVKFDYAPKSADPNVKGPAITDDNLKERLANLNKVSKEDREAGDKSAPKIDQKDFSDVTKNATKPDQKQVAPKKASPQAEQKQPPSAPPDQPQHNPLEGMPKNNDKSESEGISNNLKYGAAIVIGMAVAGPMGALIAMLLVAAVEKASEMIKDNTSSKDQITGSGPQPSQGEEQGKGQSQSKAQGQEKSQAQKENLASKEAAPVASKDNNASQGKTEKEKNEVNTKTPGDERALAAIVKEMHNNGTGRPTDAKTPASQTVPASDEKVSTPKIQGGSVR